MVNSMDKLGIYLLKICLTSEQLCETWFFKQVIDEQNNVAN